MKTEELIYNLTTCPGASGFEDGIIPVLKSILEPFCAEVRSDSFKSVIGYIPCGKKNAKKVMIDAHLDQVGLIVSGINENGSVEFKNLGGIDHRILPMCEVTIFGKQPVYGIIYSADDKLFIDTGYTMEKLDKLIKVGDPVLIKASAEKLLNRNIASCAMDNRAGIVSVVLALEKLKNADIAYDLYILFSSQEELGLRGAYTGAYAIEPDAAICIDVTFGETSDTKDDVGVFKLGCGGVIFRGPNVDSKLTHNIINIARENNLPFDIEVSGGSSGTNAWAIQTAGKGVPCSIISIPMRYMHTNVETLDLRDIETVSEIIASSIQGGAF